MSALTRSGARSLRSLIPPHPFSLLSHEIDDLINRFGEPWGEDWPMSEHVPSLDLSESNGSLEAKLDVPGMSPDEIEIEVRDTGVGIAAEMRDKIFMPFFTTKPVGAGLGLGLAVSYGIVRELGGSLEAANAEQGAVFTLRLPAAPHA